MTGKIITVTQQKGGSGKTTLAAHLAVAISRLHYKSVAIVDTDPQGSLGRWFMARAERTNGAGAEIGFRTASAWGARYEAQGLAKDYDIVIIDTPPKMGVDGRPAIETADLVVVPVAPSPVDLWATEPTIEMATGAKKPTIMVLNRANARARLTGEMAQALEEMGATAARTMIGNRVIFASSMGHGSTVLEAQSSGLAAEEIGDVTHEVMSTFRLAA
ncbi:MAG: ParA family partition ATPase [Aestuariivirgaceae bacterium]